jgi:hypothetical protein
LGESEAEVPAGYEDASQGHVGRYLDGEER